MELLTKEYQEQYLKGLKVYERQTLFEPYWKALKDFKCPLCGNKLKESKRKPISYCKGRKHIDPFIITNKRLLELTGNA